MYALKGKDLWNKEIKQKKSVNPELFKPGGVILEIEPFRMVLTQLQDIKCLPKSHKVQL